MVVGVLHEAGVDLHLAGECRLELGGHVVPGRNLSRSFCELRLGGHHPQLLLPRDGFLTQRVPARVEAAAVFVRPLRRNVVRRVRGPGGVVHEEGLVGHQRLLLAHPVDRVVRHVLGEVVALLGSAVGLDRHRVLVDGRGVLVRLTADEPVEVLESAAPRPRIERPHGARLPHRHLVALAELRGGVAVERQGLGERRRRLRPHRAVARRGRGDLRDAAHPDRVVVAAGEERLAGRRAERRRMEAVVLEAVCGESFGGRRVERAAERTRRGEADVVDQDDQHVRRTLGRAQQLDRRERRVRVLRVVGGEADVLASGIGRTSRCSGVSGMRLSPRTWGAFIVTDRGAVGSSPQRDEPRFHPAGVMSSAMAQARIERRC